jgi:hypothetical protein
MEKWLELLAISGGDDSGELSVGEEGDATGGVTEMTRPVEVLEKWLELPAISHSGGEPPVGELEASRGATRQAKVQR